MKINGVPTLGNMTFEKDTISLRGYSDDWTGADTVAQTLCINAALKNINSLDLKEGSKGTIGGIEYKTSAAKLLENDKLVLERGTLFSAGGREICDGVRRFDSQFPAFVTLGVDESVRFGLCLDAECEKTRIVRIATDITDINDIKLIMDDILPVITLRIGETTKEIRCNHRMCLDVQ